MEASVTFLELSVEELLDELAGPRAAPGAGSALALTTAMAAGIVAMAARISRDQWDEAGGAAAQAEALRARAAPLAQSDARAYEEALEALGVTDVFFELFDAGHGGIEYRYPLALRYLAERLQ